MAKKARPVTTADIPENFSADVFTGAAQLEPEEGEYLGSLERDGDVYDYYEVNDEAGYTAYYYVVRDR